MGVLVCILATLVAVPVLLMAGASSDSVEVAAVVVEDTTSAADLDEELELEQLFEVEARVDRALETPAEPLDLSGVTAAVSQASDQSLSVGAPAEPVPAEPQRSAIDSLVSDDPAEPIAAPTTQPPTTAAPTTQPPTTAAPTTQPPTTAPPTTQPPTTAAPTTQPPTTAAPTTQPPTTAAPTTQPPTTAPPTTQPATTAAPVVEAPQEPAPEPTQPPAPSQPTPEQWAALRHCESSGNYSIVSRNGLYHGAYQFYQPTWDGLARQVGRTDLVGLPPSQAAPADQDALALLLWQQRGNQPWPHCGRYLPAGP